MNSDVALEVSGLSKRYGDVLALNDISLTVNKGDLFGFLGPNGAGKTTTINLLTGLGRVNSGTIKICGIDITRDAKKAQHLVGVVPDESSLYPELSGYDNLCFCAALYGMPGKERRHRAQELLDMFDLRSAANRKFSTYSKGMKRKLTFAAGIIHYPSILFLDEPTTGIDVSSARQLRQLIADIHHSGTTVFLTTHYIEEAERLCERIAFIVAGRVVRVDTTANLLQPVQGRNMLMISAAAADSELLNQLASAFPRYQFNSISKDQIQVESSAPADVAALVGFLSENAVAVNEVRKYNLSLEDVFIRVTGLGADVIRKEKEGANR